MSSVIFLLGAGASADAGLPLVDGLTRDLRLQLSNERAEFAELYCMLAKCDPEIAQNYERLFELLTFLVKTQALPFNKLVNPKLEPRLVSAISCMIMSVKEPIWHLLRERQRQANSNYMAHLRDFLPEQGRLKVFTTNYDLCVECGCRAQSIDVATGFQPKTGLWDPAAFQSQTRGINLYKLHGSLNWTLENKVGGCLIERYPPQWDVEPEFLLGPGPKLQHDDPFVSLYAEFHAALRQAKVCVVIGYSLRDEHIREPIRQACVRGMGLIEVSPSPSGYGFINHQIIREKAKDALEGGKVYEAVGKLG